MLNVTMVESPRNSGKTTRIKLKISEFALVHDKPFMVILISINVHGFSEYSTWLHKHNIKDHVNLVVVKDTEALANALRGVKNKQIEILIDEPYNISEVTQAKIISILNCEEVNNINVYGEGSIIKTKTFSDYIKGK